MDTLIKFDEDYDENGINDNNDNNNGDDDNDEYDANN